jgi:hypothetical protein
MTTLHGQVGHVLISKGHGFVSTLFVQKLKNIYLSFVQTFKVKQTLLNNYQYISFD